jgi:ectoine hydroxylase
MAPNDSKNPRDRPIMRHSKSKTVSQEVAMQLTNAQTAAYKEDGVLLLQNLFSVAEIEGLTKEIRKLADDNDKTNLKEAKSEALRALHGCDERSRIMYNLVRDPRLLEPARAMLDDDVHLFQFKVSMKPAFEGDVWKWHQDFPYWHYLDGLPEPRAVTACVYLNDVNEFNAPTWVIPRSHKTALLSHRDPALRTTISVDRPAWHDNVVADFKYILENDVVTDLANRHGIVAANGAAGTTLFFHASAAHASTWNLSPWDRIAVLITYNSVKNRPHEGTSADVSVRPDFLVTRDYTPLQNACGLFT